MEFGHPPPDGLNERSGYPFERFILLFTFLVVIMVGLAVAEIVVPREDEAPAISESVLRGDISAKTALAYSRYFPTMRAQIREAAETALKGYQEAADSDPSNPDIYRRMIILSQEIEPRDDRRFHAAIEGLRPVWPEAELWLDVYRLERPTSAAAKDYEKRIRALDLGWYERVAMSRLYARAGMPERAEAERAAAESEALRTLVLLISLALVLFVTGLVGIGLLIWYSRRKRGCDRSADLPASSADPVVRADAAGYLLEAFVVYVLLLTAVQLIGSAALDAARISAEATVEVMFTATAYLFSGMLALIYLSARLHSVGWNWVAVGLRSKEPLKDALWGVGAYAAALPLVLVTAFAAKWLSRYLPTSENAIVPLFVESESLAARVAIFLLVVAAAPFFEELFFRGVLFSSLRARWGVGAGVIVSAVAFGLVHPLPLGLLPILVLGIVFAVAFNQRGSLLTCIVAHACNNAVAFALLSILAG
ncbi:MAG: CPBP family intramembrane metalloprotease [Armatimonadetes bacterium]|nr:CPBP family intramembrane metalloprotease [Armatimonadota bacterium]